MVRFGLSWAFIAVIVFAGYGYLFPENEDEMEQRTRHIEQRKDSLAIGFGHLASIRLENDSTVSESMVDIAQDAIVRYVFTNGKLTHVLVVGYGPDGRSKRTYRAWIDMGKSMLWQRSLTGGTPAGAVDSTLEFLLQRQTVR